MEPKTVSGNDIPTESGKAFESKNETPVTSDTDNYDSSEAVSSNSESVTNNYTYEIDNSEVCSILNELLSETVKNNEALIRIADSLDVIKDSLAAEPEETVLSDDVPEEPEETKEPETLNDDILEILEGMEETFEGIRETGESIYATVSGNSVILEDLNSTASGITESYAEASENQLYTNTYSLAIGAALIFVAACIAGICISKQVWGRMR